MESQNVHIAAIQETKFTSKTKIKPTPNYTLVRKDRGKDIKGGGLAFLIHQTIPFQTIQTPSSPKDDPHLEELTIQINNQQNNPIQIRNLYIPPASSCQADYEPPIHALADELGDAALILGDLNAHHNLWLSEATEDRRGKAISDWLDSSTLGILNEDSATRVTSNASTAPDISLASPTLLPTCSWQVNTAMSSDHLPIHITLATHIKKISAPNKTFINFKKANWEGFKNYTEEIFNKTPVFDDPHKGEKFFRQTLNKGAKRFIPAGRIHKIFNAMPSDVAKLIEQRDNLRQNNPSNPQINELTKEINNATNQHRKESWLQHLENCPPGSKKLWDTIKNLNNPTRRNDNQSIQFNGKHLNDPKKICTKFNEQYTPGATTKPTKEFRNTLRNIQKKPTDPEFLITTQQTTEAIQKSKNSKALGPDELSPIMLKHIGPHATRHLTNTFNRVVNTATIPPLWKVGRIIPLPKPGKPADEGPSYRPISLLAPAAKILETILLKPIQDSINLKPHQHGFRKGRSTQTALQEITSHIKHGLNKKKPVDRTVMVAIDLSKAFDTVDHEILIKDIATLPLNAHIKRFLAAYLHGRQSYAKFRGAKSKYRKMRQGVPQGGVLSPLLFNFYMAGMPLPLEEPSLSHMPMTAPP